MQFKSEQLQHEYAQLPAMLQVISDWFCQLSIAHFEKDPVVTRVFEHVCGSSGVHEVGRGIDFRDEHGDNFMYEPTEVRFLVSEMNRRFKRKDRKLTCIHHSFDEGPAHFHLQLGLPGITSDSGNPTEALEV